MADPSAASPSPLVLTHPGALIDTLARCMSERVAPQRSGWSAAPHLIGDLERHFGVTVTWPALEGALRVLSTRGRVSLRVDEVGALWYRLRT